jgi:hypothetical protein
MSIEFFQSRVIRAEEQHNLSTSALRTAELEVQNVDARLTEKHAALDKVIADARSQAIDEPTAALRKAVLEADVRDLGALLAQAQSMASAEAAKAQASESELRNAQEQVRALENKAAVDALGETIGTLEQKLVAAIAEKARLLGGSSGSYFNVWQPSRELKHVLRTLG